MGSDPGFYGFYDVIASVARQSRKFRSNFSQLLKREQNEPNS